MTKQTRTLAASSVALAVLAGSAFFAAKHQPQRVVQRSQIGAALDANSAQAAALPVSGSLPAPAPPSPAATAPTPEDESALMSELRTFKDTDPEFAIERARDGNRRFPDSADAAERSSILIHALAASGRASEARGEAEDMVNHYPDSEWVREVERFTGAHRHRNVHLNAEGQLAFD